MRFPFGVALAIMLAGGAASAVEVAGVSVADAIMLRGDDRVLNGAGIRTRAIFKVYVGALYVVRKETTVAEAIASRGPKRIALHLLRDLAAGQLLGGALNDGLAANLTDSERAQFKVQIDEIKATMDSVGAARERSLVSIDCLPDTGTRISVDGTARGKTIAGGDFYRALMKIRLGEKPGDRSLKSAMLGQPS